MPDILIFLVGLFAFVPFLAGLTLMVLTAPRVDREVGARDQIKRP